MDNKTKHQITRIEKNIKKTIDIVSKGSQLLQILNYIGGTETGLTRLKEVIAFAHMINKLST